MTRPEFIKSLKVQTSDAAVFGTKANLQRPPGRKPRECDVRLAAWYRGLSSSDRDAVEIAMREAAELAVFSFLCVLDGVSAIENGPSKGDLLLLYRNGEMDLLLNDPREGFLHDEYNALCQTSNPALPSRQEASVYEVCSTKDLRAGQKSNDALDLHTVAPAGLHTPESPAIALPKNEHRKL